MTERAPESHHAHLHPDLEKPRGRKRANPDTPPLLSWCLVVRNCERTLRATLESLRERTPDAEIVVVDTMSFDTTPDIAREYADVFREYAGPAGSWTRADRWVDDMASARQFSFELASGVWRGWADGDDRLPGPDEAKEHLIRAGQYKPTAQGDKVEGDADQAVSLIDILSEIRETYPWSTCLWAPYLYKRDENGHCETWQVRERIVLWEAGWRWAERGHEVLVPTSGQMPQRVEISHLLFLHEKDWTAGEVTYSQERHYAVIREEYEQEPTSRRAWYLASFTNFLPGRSHETVGFIESAYELADNILDKVRALIMAGQWHARRGLGVEAFEAFGAATTIAPEMPDAWIAGAESAFAAEDWGRAAEWFERAIACEYTPRSLVNPRFLLVRYPTMLALSLEKMADQALYRRDPATAEQHLERAVGHLLDVFTCEAIGDDREEASARLHRLDNRLRGVRAMGALVSLHGYLMDNDETQKAADLVDCIPWNGRTDPRCAELHQFQRKIYTHILDDEAYAAFYADDQETGLALLPLSAFEFSSTEPRVQWLVEEIRARGAGRVLEIGPADGIVALVALREIPELEYVALEISESAANALQRNAVKLGVDDRLTVIRVPTGEFVLRALEGSTDDVADADVVVWAEVIEHVGEPEAYMHALASYCVHHGASLLITTPWGAYDLGHPPPTNIVGNPRDPRGHVRALLPSDIRLLAHETGFIVEDATRLGGDGQRGCALVARLEVEHIQSLHPEYEDIVATDFFVAGALWQWNQRIVEREGIGASEEMVIAHARRLAAAEVDVTVFGPTPDEDIRNDVLYAPRECIWESTASVGIVVRSPVFYRRVDCETGRRMPLILWLQDTTYVDLDQDAIDRYAAIVCVSEWHKRLLMYPEAYGIGSPPVPEHKLHVIYNSLDPAHFEQRVERDPHRFIYASSPDRGLNKLLELWPRIRDAVPDATLDVYYGWRGCNKLGGTVADSDWTKIHRRHRKRFEELRVQPGITEHGLVSHMELARAFLSAGVWAYPTGFHETGCLTAVKARAGGAFPVTSTVAALSESAACGAATLLEWGSPTYDDDFVDACARATRLPESERATMMMEARRYWSIGEANGKLARLIWQIANDHEDGGG